MFPRDAEGGTWIAANASGIAFTILNRNGARRPKNQSRGDVIPQLVSSRSLKDASERLRTLDVIGTLSFTLMIFSAPEEQLSEHIWDGELLRATNYEWAARNWFSSGLSDQTAKEHRSEIVVAGKGDDNYGSLEWMRRLHRAHGTAPDPFSICVHRQEVGSVSYTEIIAEPDRITMFYWAGSPCQSQSATPIHLTLPSPEQKPMGA
jgi:hypothetical protein